MPRTPPQPGTGRKAASIWPLPGGTGHLLESLGTFIDLAADRPLVDDYVYAVIDEFPGVTSAKAARSYMRVVIDLGFAETSRGRISITPDGRRFRRSGSPKIVRDALRKRIAGIDELIDELKTEPDRIGLLLPRMQGRGFAWTTTSQVRYRLRWLEEVGMVTQEGRARPIYSIVSPKRAKAAVSV